ncbi:MAG: hydrogenase iron-sulfur subunit, partial [Anaerolineales bacterium]
MVDAARHPNIELLTYTEVKRVEGFIGNFKVLLEEKPRYVIADLCTGCGDCAPVCPIEVSNEFEEGIAPRKAIYIPHSQASPLLYTIDLDNCIKCYKCVDACGKLDAIDFGQQPKQTWLDVGSIVVATGFDSFDPTPLEEYGYGHYDNVITTLELERINNSAGPTGGRIMRPSDGKMPESVAFVQCVGSRDERFQIYCSGFCCMYTIKNAIQWKLEHPETDISIFYMDIRTPAKGYEEFYRRAREMGIRFIQGRPSRITQDEQTGNLFIQAEDQSLGRVIELESELVVLSTAAVPREDAGDVGSILNISRSPSGFFMEYHPKLRPVDSPTDGVFLAGAAQGPKDIPSSVAQGAGAAARAARILGSDTWEIEPIVAVVWEDRCVMAQGKKCGICATKCPYSAIITQEGIAANVTAAKCHGCGGCVAECPHNAITQMHFTDAQIFAQLRALLAKDAEKKILAFMCHWCSYGGADTAGTSHFEYPASSRGIRVMCSARMDQDFVFEAFRLGAGMVLVSGCHPQDCHYITGQQVGAERFERLAKRLENMGISPDRFRVEWISAAEGGKYARVIREMDETLKALDPEALKEEIERVRPELEKRLRRITE